MSDGEERNNKKCDEVHDLLMDAAKGTTTLGGAYVAARNAAYDVLGVLIITALSEVPENFQPRHIGEVMANHRVLAALNAALNAVDAERSLLRPRSQ